MEVQFYNNDVPFIEYKTEFMKTRNSDSTEVQFAELELPGLLIADSNTDELSMAPPTQFPTIAPVPNPTMRSVVQDSSSAKPTLCMGNNPNYQDTWGDGCEWYEMHESPGCPV